MKHSILAAAMAAALTGCAGTASRDQLNIQNPTVLQRGFGAPQDVSSGAATKQWTDVYTQIKHRGDVLDTLQGRLDAAGPRKDSYAGAKAQCWINAGKEAFAAHDDWGFVEEAIGEAARLTISLDVADGATPSAAQATAQSEAQANPALRTVAKVRPDLWDQLTKVRVDPRFAWCPQARKLVACSEVELMYAGHEAWTRAFDKAKQRTDALQDQVRASEQALSSCAVPAPPPLPLPKVMSLSSDALFAFDRGDVSAITPQGRAQLDDIANRLRDSGFTDRMTVSGYTDRLGTSLYNLRLSRQRANSVKQYLISKGVTIPIDAQGFGKADPGTACTTRDRKALIECLAPDRRVDIRFVGQKTVTPSQ
ncbi:OmpA family protein [Paraburkholderia sartisoli]|uniref:Outer membrane protein OmpA n=1 Tax=Paraburkholderia sartisoli TaxID=83784 RepID=A0A1H4AB73_9BURK|nr:OmpA family protein [Paraburkholderia sartisoli]SEA33245.1 Outer membrane protein OmpA [Paraburkholderia sartisoli]